MVQFIQEVPTGGVTCFHDDHWKMEKIGDADAEHTAEILADASWHRPVTVWLPQSEEGRGDNRG